MAEWDAAYINDLPDSCFAYIEPGGTKDAEGKTVPRSKRHFPIRDAQGNYDAAHIRNAMARASQSPFGDMAMPKIRAAAQAMGIGMMGKAEPLDPDELSGWIAGRRPRRLLAIPFGGPLPNPQYAKGMDLDREWFSERTDIKPRWFDARPITWQHGDDRVMGNEPLGKADNLSLEEDGWWVDAWITAHDRRVGLIKTLSEQLAARGGALYGSSAPIGRFVKTAKSGEILVWPYAEQTLGTAVQNTRSVLRPGKALADFDIAGISVSDPLRTVLTELDALGADLASPLDFGPGEESAKAGRVLSAATEAAIKRAAEELRALLALVEKPEPPDVAYAIEDEK